MDIRIGQRRLKALIRQSKIISTQPASRPQKEPEPLGESIFDHLVYAPTIYKHRSASCIVLRRWRSETKRSDIAFLKTFKQNVTDDICQVVGSELTGFLKLLFRTVGGFTVIYPPRGASKGEKYFAAEIARQVAGNFDLPIVQMFEDRIRGGNSHHPLKTLDRTPLVVKVDHPGPFLLVDDIVTSGNTIEECINALPDRTIIPLVWIGGELNR
jgi:hypothetical protein